MEYLPSDSEPSDEEIEHQVDDLFSRFDALYFEMMNKVVSHVLETTGETRDADGV